MNLADLPDAYRLFCEAWAKGLEAPPRMSVSEWADAHRVLTTSESSEPGPWRTDRVPFMREIMDSLSPHSPVQRVVFMKSTQIAGTEAGVNWCGSVIDRFPAPMLVVEPTIEVGELWSKQRLARMIEASDSLSQLIRPSRSRDSGNTTLLKEFPGGILRVAGANSAASLRSMPVKYLFLDEVDAYPHDLDGEGDPVGLAEERTNNFPRRKVFLVSTPTIKGASRIETEYERSDQRRYHVPCPHCGHRQVLQWSNLKWDAELTRAWYVCADSGCIIEEHHKNWMLANGEWVALFPEREVRGYHINSLYSPIGLGRTWLERAREWVLAQGDPAALKKFVNTCLGETWEDRSNEVKPHALQARAENYKLRTIPVGCLILTLGVDTQDDRLELQLLGWGRGDTCWVLDRHVIPGDPARDEVWNALDRYIDTPLRNQYGVDMQIMATAIDTGGHHTHTVYNYVRLRAHKRVIGVKGSSQAGKAILARPSKVDVDWKGQTIKGGVLLWQVGTDTAKSALFARLAGDATLEVGQRKVHFSSELELDYYEQLTAEAFDPEKQRWVKRKGRRNESLDTWVYGYAAALHPDIRIHTAREVEWARLESMVQPLVVDMFNAPPGLAPVATADPPGADTASRPVPAQVDAGPAPQPDPAPAGSLHSGDSWLPETEDWL